MIHIITAVHNRQAITSKFIDFLIAQTYKEIHLILVDDGCTDSTVDIALLKLPETTVIKGDGNLYWGGGLNEAYKWVRKNLTDCGEEFLMIANDDTEFAADYLSKAICHLEENKNTLITGNGIGNCSGKRKDGVIHFDFQSTGEKNEPATDEDVGNCASTRSLFMRVKDFLNVGGFHPFLLPHYASDYEWTIRASRKGYSIISFADLIYILNEETTGTNLSQKVTVKRVFSKRSNYNPVYRFNFIFMVTPIHLIPKACINQVLRYIKRSWLF